MRFNPPWLVSSSEQLFISGDWNGHIGSHSTAFEDVHGGQALGKKNHEGERLLEFAVANELVVGNSWFKEKFETGKTLGERWKYLKNDLIKAAKHTWKSQTWWWNEKVQQAVSHKRKCFKV